MMREVGLRDREDLPDSEEAVIECSKRRYIRPMANISAPPAVIMFALSVLMTGSIVKVLRAMHPVAQLEMSIMFCLQKVEP
jgi:hypothetical protein